MGRQCNRNSFHKGEQLSAWLVCYGTKSQLRIQLVLELRVQKPEVQNIVIPENTTLLPESICVAVVRDSRDVCWADGKRETSSSSVPSWETPKRCAETMLWSHGSCSERGLSVLQGEGSSCSLCAMYWDTLCSGRLVCMQLKRGKKKKILQESQWAAFGLMQVLWETYILSFTLGNEVDILAVITVVRSTFSSLPVCSGILWEGSSLGSFWISCETEPARLPGTEKSYLIFKELKPTVCATEYCTRNDCFGWFVWISGIPGLLKVVTLSLNPNAAASAKYKSEDRFRFKYDFLAQP